jgi:methionine sulfoxide reductase catalytic subunit
MLRRAEWFFAGLNSQFRGRIIRPVEASLASRFNIRIPQAWELPERMATPEDAFLNRRKFLVSVAVASGVAAGLGLGASRISAASLLMAAEETAGKPLYPAPRNSKYTLDRPITPENVASRYNNFREFSDQKEAVWMMTDKFEIEPWTLRVAGLVEKPQTFDLQQLIRRMPLEERLYRHRCIEGWSMAVPWTGFPCKSLIDLAAPTSAARYVTMTSFLRPEQAEGQRIHTNYKWPMRAAISMAEAMNELAFFAVGMYGHSIPKSNGAPIRLVLPWKYGFKSIKAITSIEFVAEEPANLWNEPGHAPHDFFANVNPQDRGPRYSQARERVIGTWQTRATLPYNGYGDYVAHLYAK